jgi:hypothetical protein
VKRAQRGCCSRPAGMNVLAIHLGTWLAAVFGEAS